MAHNYKLLSLYTELDPLCNKRFKKNSKDSSRRSLVNGGSLGLQTKVNRGDGVVIRVVRLTGSCMQKWKFTQNRELWFKSVANQNSK